MNLHLEIFLWLANEILTVTSLQQHGKSYTQSPLINRAVEQHKQSEWMENGV